MTKTAPENNLQYWNIIQFFMVMSDLWGCIVYIYIYVYNSKTSTNVFLHGPPNESPMISLATHRGSSHLCQGQTVVYALLPSSPWWGSLQWVYKSLRLMTIPQYPQYGSAIQLLTMTNMVRRKRIGSNSGHTHVGWFKSVM